MPWRRGPATARAAHGLDRGERIADRGATVPTVDAAATRAATVAAALERARARRADAPPRAT